MILLHLNQGYIDDPLPQKVDCDLSESFSRKEKYWQVHRGVNNLDRIKGTFAGKAIFYGGVCMYNICTMCKNICTLCIYHVLTLNPP